MSAEPFLDTNVLVYIFDQQSTEKAERARQLTRNKNWQTSWQVLQEFSNVALHRFKTPMKEEDLDAYLKLVLWPRCSVFPNAELFSQALTIRARTQYRLYDSLIVASALVSGAEILYSEDLQHGRDLGGLTIQNPFL
ncbi:MAG: PIN domain-containing protein [Verrucomicrobiales bacterium]|jgi:predicted nucleic acid-binding protein|nr:PIN domain-containing protein [Verrucomicrobiales bacterium]